MKYNQVRIGDGVIANEKNVVIHSLGTLDWNRIFMIAFPIIT